MDEACIIQILEEIQRSGDMSFECPKCKDVIAFDNPKCYCGFNNPIHAGLIDMKNINNHRWL